MKTYMDDIIIKKTTFFEFRFRHKQQYITMFLKTITVLVLLMPTIVFPCKHVLLSPQCFEKKKNSSQTCETKTLESRTNTDRTCARIYDSQQHVYIRI